MWLYRQQILEKFKSVEELNWPPTAEELSSDKRKPPDEVFVFLKELLTVDSKKSELQWTLSISNSQGTGNFVRDRESSR